MLGLNTKTCRLSRHYK